jgi:hypothetical protein
MISHEGTRSQLAEEEVRKLGSEEEQEENGTNGKYP